MFPLEKKNSNNQRKYPAKSITRVRVNKLRVANQRVASLSHNKLRANMVASCEPMNQKVNSL